MLQVFKWLWNKGKAHGESELLAMINSQAQYHQLMSETAALKDEYEPYTQDDLLKYSLPRHTAQEHKVMAQALYKISSDYWKIKDQGDYDGR